MIAVLFQGRIGCISIDASYCHKFALLKLWFAILAYTTWYGAYCTVIHYAVSYRIKLYANIGWYYYGVQYRDDGSWLKWSSNDMGIDVGIRLACIFGYLLASQKLKQDA